MKMEKPFSEKEKRDSKMKQTNGPLEKKADELRSKFVGKLGIVKVSMRPSSNAVMVHFKSTDFDEQMKSEVRESSEPFPVWFVQDLKEDK